MTKEIVLLYDSGNQNFTGCTHFQMQYVQEPLVHQLTLRAKAITIAEPEADRAVCRGLSRSGTVCSNGVRRPFATVAIVWWVNEAVVMPVSF